jgi:hypothetical protein
MKTKEISENRMKTPSSERFGGGRRSISPSNPPL